MRAWSRGLTDVEVHACSGSGSGSEACDRSEGRSSAPAGLPEPTVTEPAPGDALPMTKTLP
jgi:hypothetical protein